MTSFGWKRKQNANLSAESAENFKHVTGARDSSEEEEDTTASNFFLNLAKKRKIFILEDCVTKSERLVKEGVILAEAERYWEAIKKWDEALQLTPGKSSIYEMKAQALMELSEVFPAVQAAEKTVTLNPLWWTAHQTLARAQLGLGEVEMAKKSISRAIHINPAEMELWEDDLKWISSLCEEKKQIHRKKPAAKKEDG
ncbi:tetratricopeptide repeat protein 33-like isoform X2 [Apostichopus japonicus]